MCVALQGGCITTEVDRLLVWFSRTCVGPPHVTVPVAGRLLVVLILAPTFRNPLRQTAEIQAGLMFAWWAYLTPCPSSIPPRRTLPLGIGKPNCARHTPQIPGSQPEQAPGVVCPIRKLESLSKPQAALVSRGVRVRKSILRLACQGTKNWVNGILRQRMCRQGHGPFGEFGPFGLGRLFGAARMGSLVGAFDWGCFDYSGDMGWGPQRPSRSAVVDGPCGTAHVIARAGLEAN